MDTVLIEQATVGYLAVQLNMVIDNDIFRGGMPSEIVDASALVLNRRAGVERRSQDAFSVSLYVRRTDRDDLLGIESLLASLLPVFGATFDQGGFTVAFHSIKRDGFGGITSTSFNSQECFLLDQKLEITVNSISAIV